MKYGCNHGNIIQRDRAAFRTDVRPIELSFGYYADSGVNHRHPSWIEGRPGRAADLLVDIFLQSIRTAAAAAVRLEGCWQNNYCSPRA